VWVTECIMQHVGPVHWCLKGRGWQSCRGGCSQFCRAVLGCYLRYPSVKQSVPIEALMQILLYDSQSSDILDGVTLARSRLSTAIQVNQWRSDQRTNVDDRDVCVWERSTMLIQRVISFTRRGHVFSYCLRKSTPDISVVRSQALTGLTR